MHVPFCRRHCPYCDFAVVVSARPPLEEYLQAVLAEWRARKAALDGREIVSLYLGGGTPSQWGVERIATLIGEVQQAAPTPLREITVEANPEDVTAEWAHALRQAGATRLSLGVQSFDDRTLQLLGRNHTGAAARQAVEDAVAAGFDEVSFDLIWGVPDEPESRLEHDLGVFAAFGEALGHVSTYELTLEAKTPFAARIARGATPLPPEDTVWKDGRRIVERLGAMGLERYEVSNFARPGHEAVHNSLYWRGDDYLGLGIGAHSLEVGPGGIIRRANARPLRPYLEGKTEVLEERLSPSLHVAELIMLGVRTRAGVDLGELRGRFGEEIVAPQWILAGQWAARGLGSLEGERFLPRESTLDIADLLGEESLVLAEADKF